MPAFISTSTRFRLAIIIVLLTGAWSAARAADTGTDADRRPARRDDLPADTERRPPPLAVFDTDHDGTISAAEISAASEVLRRLDRNHDGKLTGDELNPRRGRRGDGGQRPPGDGDEPPES